MPERVALCLEDLDARDDEAHPRYLQCVALRGVIGEVGLGLDARGQARWREPGAAACELFVSADDRLMLLRGVGAPPVVVRRAGRSLEAPEGKPVVLVDRDGVEIGGRRLRIHVHGPAPAVAAPAVVLPAGRSFGTVGRLATAVAVSASLLGCPGGSGRQEPGGAATSSSAAGGPVRPSGAAPDAGQPGGGRPGGDASSAPVAAAGPADAGVDAIEIREHPPKIARPVDGRDNDLD